VLCIDEGGDAARALGVGDGVQGESGLTRRLRPIDLDDAATREAADAERDIQCDGPGGDHLDRSTVIAAKAHDGTLAELAVDLGECCFE
jgi:hypothetical protein